MTTPPIFIHMWAGRHLWIIIENMLTIVLMWGVVIVAHDAPRMLPVHPHDSLDEIIGVLHVIIDEEHAIFRCGNLENLVPLVYIGILR